MDSDKSIANSESSVVAALRRSTRAEHLQLEDELDLLSSDLTEVRYVKVLQTFAQIYAPVEDALNTSLSPAVRAALQWESRRKLPWLLDDLDYFNALEQSVPDEPPFSIVTSEDALGVLYVMEGATLGAQTIYPHLRACGVGNHDRGTRFFRSYEHLSGPMWAATRSTLRDELVSESQQQAAVSGARNMFVAMLTAFRRNGAVVAGVSCA